MKRLNFNESPFPLPQEVIEDFQERISAAPLNRYGSSHGEGLTEKLSGLYGIPSENIAVGNGSDELLKILTEVFVSPGDTVLTITPHFVVYPEYVELAGGRFIGYEMDEDLNLSEEGFLSLIEETRPSLIFLCTPHNPTGSLLTPAFIDRVIEVSDGVVVIDEAYIEFSQEASYMERSTAHPRIICARTFSKAFGAAGVRLGYITASMKNIKRINSRRLIFSLSVLSETMGEVIIDNHHHFMDSISFIISERERICREVVNPGCRIFPSQASFILVRTSVDLYTLMKTENILISRLKWKEGFYRIFVGSREDNNRVIHILNSI